MAYKPLELEVNGKTVSLTTAGETLTRTFRDENTAAQKFGDVLENIKTTLYTGMG